ncbi:MAG: hypothetical protein IH991_13595 [Planctomycetes bacterium]|nr:hypothetical protein [Planctomycetota bacterium]
MSPFGDLNPDVYVVVYKNGADGELIFLTPKYAVIDDTHTPMWNVRMSKFFTYNPGKKDFLTILVLDRDTSVIDIAWETIRKMGGGFVRLPEKTWDEDDLIGRWEGPIPRELLASNEDIEWKLSFDHVVELRMVIEKLPPDSR